MRLTRYRPLPILIGLALASGTALVAEEVHAQAPAGAEDVNEPVAAALYDRGMVLYEQGDVANAKKMFSESLGRSPKGSRAADALRMLRECNEKLGVQDLDAGRPTTGPTGPIDPYEDGPLDPYGDGSGAAGADGNAPIDPYGEGATNSGGGLEGGPIDGGQDQEGKAGRVFIAHGALQGFMAGMAILGPYEKDEFTDETGDLRAGAVALGLASAGATGYLSYFLADRQSLTMTQGNVIASAGFWGMYNGAHLGNLFGGQDSDGNDIYTGMAISGLLGTGVGYWFAKEKDPTEGALAFTNSMTLYGTTGGLLFGVALDPPRGDAYSLNAVLGSAAGLGVAYYVDGETPTRKRMLKVDLGAGVGAVAPWILVYPFMADSNSNDDEQTAGLLSVIGLVGGGYAMWRYTDGENETDPEAASPEGENAAPPAVVRRDSQGKWSLSTPAIRPMHLPALAPRRGTSFGTDLVSGRF
jgi:hypothetical protein